MTTKTEAKDGPPKKPDPKPITSGLAFSGICNVRNTEAHLRWLGAQLSFFLNLPAFGTIIFRLAIPPSTRELAVIAISGAMAIVANVFLVQVIRRDNRHLDLWNDKLDKLERANGIEGGVQVFSSRRYRKLRNARHRLQNRLDWAMVSCIVGWVLVVVIAAILYINLGGDTRPWK